MNYKTEKLSIMESNKCNHKWMYTPEFSICEKCGEMIISERMKSVSGVILSDNPLKRLVEDETERTDVPPLNDIHD